ncbi:MAG: methyltransferase domain-containing protein [Pseudonocardiaceae bacterium]
MTTSEQLVAALEAAQALPASWREAFLAVPREQFIPAQIWVSDGERDVPLDYHSHPDRWRAAVYGNTTLVTQFDDGATAWPAVGRRATSSASDPDVVAEMLDCLQVCGGQRVLELGTGTGYSTALLAHRIGAVGVTTVEIDPVVAAAAKAALQANGYPVTTVVGDAAAGYPANAPYDRVIATVAASLGAVPSEWLAQTRPGGVIVTPVRTDYVGSGALVRFTVHAEGTATGHPVSKVGFMPLRAQRSPCVDLSFVEVADQDGAAEASQTTTPPWLVATTVDVRWAISTRIAPCRWGHRPPTATHPQHQLWFADHATGSWAIARYDRCGGPYPIRQHGPRHLWDEIDGAYRWWCDQGEPPLTQWRLSISRDQQTTSLDAAH